VKPRAFSPVAVADGRHATDAATGLKWHASENRVLYADTDRSGVVYHSNYLRYFEMGRAALMRDWGHTYREIEEAGYVYPIVDAALKYENYLRYDELMRIYTRPARIERVKLTFDYVILSADTGKVACRGHTTHCCLNRDFAPVAVDPRSARLFADYGVTRE
jgi:acyl-CoA thioester hydrolase